MLLYCLWFLEIMLNRVYDCLDMKSLKFASKQSDQFFPYNYFCCFNSRKSFSMERFNIHLHFNPLEHRCFEAKTFSVFSSDAPRAQKDLTVGCWLSKLRGSHPRLLLVNFILLPLHTEISQSMMWGRQPDRSPPWMVWFWRKACWSTKRDPTKCGFLSTLLFSP